MKLIIIATISILAILAACKEQPTTRLADVQCPTERPEVCIEVYQPVCGWYNASIQCIKYPCANTYSNSCQACADKKVESWTQGQCPSEFNTTKKY